MQNDNTTRIMEPSPAQQRAEQATLMASWPTGERKPEYVNDPFFAQFCFAIAEALLEHAKITKS